MARLEYLAFDGTATSAATLTLCGYAQATRDSQGRLMPDTVLVLEGVTVASIEPEAKDWAVSLAESWNGIKVTLIQSQANAREGALRSITRTATTWYKDDTARSTQKVTETTYRGNQPNTWKLVTTAPWSPAATPFSASRSSRRSAVDCCASRIRTARGRLCVLPAMNTIHVAAERAV